MLQILDSGRVLLDGCIIGGLHPFGIGWIFQAYNHAHIIHSDTVRDNVIAWLLDIIQDGILAL